MNNVQPQFNQMPANQPAGQPKVLPPNIVSFEVEGQKIQLSDTDVLNYILDPKTANQVAPHEVIYFLQQCKAQKLNPFARDCYLIKYKADAPAQIVTSQAAMEKRAENFPAYAGMKAGVIVLTNEGEIIEREGTVVVKQKGEQLIGGWAEVYRTDRKNPIKATVNFDEYNTGQSTWKQKPGVMIRKCAKSMAFREAFPKQNAGLYDTDEIRTGVEDSFQMPQQIQAIPIQNPNPYEGLQFEDVKTGEIVEPVEDNPYAG